MRINKIKNNQKKNIAVHYQLAEDRSAIMGEGEALV
jgi:hypothetical protein